MIGALLCLLAMGFVYWTVTRRSLGHGLGATMAVGYWYGILRANFPDGGSHFLFDAALAALYVGSFTGRRARRPDPQAAKLRPWAMALMGWPCLLLFVPSQHIFVQLVGLRAAAWFLPCLLLGARASEDDLRQFSLWLAGLNLIALGFGAAEFVFGVERFFPYNAVTDLIYRSGDVGSEGALRIPSMFANAHAYGGTMVAGLPVLLGGWVRARQPRERALFVAAIAAAGMGIFLCAARLPVIYLFALSAYFLLSLPLSSGRRATALVLIALVAAVVGRSDRLQRFSSLTDPEKVSNRIQVSLNVTFVELMLEHPLGEGLASASGTSVPFFLESYAKPQIGLENEYGRIAMEQSLLGLGLWVAFIAYTLVRYPRHKDSWRIGRRLMWAMVALLWATAFIGTGILTAIPGTVLLLLYMGVLWRVPARKLPRRSVAARPQVRGATPPAETHQPIGA